MLPRRPNLGLPDRLQWLCAPRAPVRGYGSLPALARLIHPKTTMTALDHTHLLLLWRDDNFIFPPGGNDCQSLNWGDNDQIRPRLAAWLGIQRSARRGVNTAVNRIHEGCFSLVAYPAVSPLVGAMIPKAFLCCRLALALVSEAGCVPSPAGSYQLEIGKPFVEWKWAPPATIPGRVACSGSVILRHPAPLGWTSRRPGALPPLGLRGRRRGVPLPRGLPAAPEPAFAPAAGSPGGSARGWSIAGSDRGRAGSPRARRTRFSGLQPGSARRAASATWGGED